MLLGVIADTHDNLPKIAAATELFARRGVGHILHAGDLVAPFALRLLLNAGIPVTGVFGNNDGELTGLKKLCDTIYDGPHRFDLAGRTIVVTHDVVELGAEPAAGADLIVYGHSHEVSLAAGQPLRINPGEAGGWVTGRSTAALVDLADMRAEVMELGAQETIQI
ncbi:MAG: metallophosphoesterase [Planctomycetota bacterium]|jgi:putative phosphoesterase